MSSVSASEGPGYRPVPPACATTAARDRSALDEKAIVLAKDMLSCFRWATLHREERFTPWLATLRRQGTMCAQPADIDPDDLHLICPRMLS